MKNLKNSSNQYMEGTERKKAKNWSSFVSSDVISFFNNYGIEKMTLSDGAGNKAILTRQKNDEIKVETSSTSIY